MEIIKERQRERMTKRETDGISNHMRMLPHRAGCLGASHTSQAKEKKKKKDRITLKCIQEKQKSLFPLSYGYLSEANL